MSFADFLTEQNIRSTVSIDNTQTFDQNLALGASYAAIKGLIHVSNWAVDIDKDALSDPKDVVFDTLDSKVVYSYKREKISRYLIEVSSECIVSVNFNTDNIYCMIWAKEEEFGDKVRNNLIEAFPPAKMKIKQDDVPISFWSLNMQGNSVARTRKINALDWANIENNYHAKTKTQLDTLINLRPPIDGGKLVLWHGPPGTGKSSALRSLAQKWLPWCDISYVLDPEKFFNVTDYMMEVCLDTPAVDYTWETDDEDDALVLEGEERWRILIVEDASEFITVDAKDRTGQGLSRLLNLGDGLIGQGINLLTLITTNEDIKDIHQAVSREGRCIANIEFRGLSQIEANGWCDSNDLSRETLPNRKDNWTLAELYDLRRTADKQQIKTEKEDHSVGVYL